MARRPVSSFRDSNFGDEEGPDWVQDLEFGSDSGLGEGTGDDEFEALRQRSARAGAVYEEMELDEEAAGAKPGRFSLNQFTPGQRLILALLVLLNVIVGGIAILAFAGVLG